jgi:hypothetical protein
MRVPLTPALSHPMGEGESLGTVSGAPKIRAMQIIADLEGTTRGPYGGCVGYFSFNGNLDTCITIRTALLKDGKAYMQAAAGWPTRSKVSAAIRAAGTGERRAAIRRQVVAIVHAVGAAAGNLQPDIRAGEKAVVDKSIGSPERVDAGG